MTKPTIVIVIEGGAVQDIISDDPDACGDVFVIDYDTDGAEPDELTLITQSDGADGYAYVSQRDVSEPEIDLQQVRGDDAYVIAKSDSIEHLYCGGPYGWVPLARATHFTRAMMAQHPDPIDGFWVTAERARELEE